MVAIVESSPRAQGLGGTQPFVFCNSVIIVQAITHISLGLCYQLSGFYCI